MVPDASRPHLKRKFWSLLARKPGDLSPLAPVGTVSSQSCLRVPGVTVPSRSVVWVTLQAPRRAFEDQSLLEGCGRARFCLVPTAGGSSGPAWAPPCVCGVKGRGLPSLTLQAAAEAEGSGHRLGSARRTPSPTAGHRVLGGQSLCTSHRGASWWAGVPRKHPEASGTPAVGLPAGAPEMTTGKNGWESCFLARPRGPQRSGLAPRGPRSPCRGSEWWLGSAWASGSPGFQPKP